MPADALSPCPWEKVRVGTRVRFATETFVRRGTVVRVKGRSIELQLDGELRSTVIPDGQTYWEQSPDNSWHMVRIKNPTPPALTDISEELTFQQAMSVVGVDAKTLRRYLRSGKVQGRQEDGRWVSIDASSARASRR